MSQGGSVRHTWMDLLRGTAIVLVIVWHAPAIPRLLGYEIPAWLLLVNNGLLPFRMPTLMFLSGMLLDRSLAKGAGRYYSGKLRALVWPYLLWSALHLLTFDHRSLAELVEPMRWFAVGYLWFLFFIMVYYLAAPLLVRLPDWLVPVGAAVASWWIDSPQLSQMAYFAIFFFVGRIASRHVDTLIQLASNRVVVTCGVVIAVGFGTASALAPERLTYQAEFAPFALICVFVGVAGAKAVLLRWDLAALRSIGRSSIVYYVSHFPIMHAVTSGAIALGIENVVVVALVNAVAALLLGWCLAALKQTPPVSWLFAAPQLSGSSRQ